MINQKALTERLNATSTKTKMPFYMENYIKELKKLSIKLEKKFRA